MTDVLLKRMRDFRARIAVKRWDYRQRNLARGVWPRLVRLLAEASEGWAISERDADALLAEGYRVEPTGQVLEPEKRIFFVPQSRVRAMEDRKELLLRLGTPLLTARSIALIRFP